MDNCVFSVKALTADLKGGSDEKVSVFFVIAALGIPSMVLAGGYGYSRHGYGYGKMHMHYHPPRPVVYPCPPRTVIYPPPRPIIYYPPPRPVIYYPSPPRPVAAAPPVIIKEKVIVKEPLVVQEKHYHTYMPPPVKKEIAPKPCPQKPDRKPKPKKVKKIYADKCCKEIRRLSIENRKMAEELGTLRERNRANEAWFGEYRKWYKSRR
jgi:hypothetical protein